MSKPMDKPEETPKDKPKDKMVELEAAVSELAERVATLEAQREHMADVIFGLLDGTRRHSAVLAIMVRFTEAEDDALNDFFRWALSENEQQALTAARVRTEWDKRMPQTLQDKLEQIIAARRKDGELAWLTGLFDGEGGG